MEYHQTKPYPQQQPESRLGLVPIVIALLFLSPLTAIFWIFIAKACNSWTARAVWFALLFALNLVIWFTVIQPSLYPNHVETPYERNIRELHELETK